MIGKSLPTEFDPNGEFICYCLWRHKNDLPLPVSGEAFREAPCLPVAARAGTVHRHPE